MDLRFLSLDDPEWVGLLAELPHDIYHLPGYQEICAGEEGGRAEAVLVHDGPNRFFVPYLLRAIPGSDHHDLSTAYGCPGPLVAGSPGFFGEAARAWGGAMRERGVVSGFVRGHPLLDTPVADAPGAFVDRGPTVAIDLSLSKTELWRQTAKSHRNQINKARRTGLQARWDPAFDRLDRFHEIYRETMARRGASARYDFGREYFAGLKRALGDRLQLCVVEDPSGRVLSAGLFTTCAGIVQFHLSGTRDDALPQRPSKLMLDVVRAWAKERGESWFHLGGGVGGREDSLFDFKAGFSDGRRRFRTWHLIFDPAAYEALSAQADPGADPEFFPRYRAPRL